MSRAQLTSTVEQNTGGSVSPFLAGKNAVINGGMDIWQRGTSITNGYPVYGADRWFAYGDGSEVHSQQPTGDTTNLPNIRYCQQVKRTASSTSTNLAALAYSIETADSIRFAGQTVTLSFYARAGANYSAASSALAYTISYGTGTDQNIVAGYTGNTNIATGSVTLTTTWQRFTVTTTISSSATELGFYFGFTPTGTAGANDYYQITGVQLEQGKVATPFSRAGGTLQGELALCMRYYEQSYDIGTAIGTNTQNGQVTFRGLGYAASSSGGSPTTAVWNEITIPYEVKKRIPATVTIYSSYTGTAGRFRNYDGSTDLAGYSIDGNGQQAFTFGAGQFINPNYYCGFHWTASAEL